MRFLDVLVRFLRDLEKYFKNFKGKFVLVDSVKCFCSYCVVVNILRILKLSLY